MRCRREPPAATWAERLPAGLGRILAVNLGTLLAKDGFIVITGERQPVVDYEPFLVVDSFERDPQSQQIYRQPVAAASNPDDAAAAEVQH